MAISDQLRRAIRSSGASRYVLSRATRVYEPTLSRLLAGKRGLTLDAIDRLASALGLHLVTTVQRTPHPSPRGRRLKNPKPPIPLAKSSKAHWMELDRTFAKDAHENHLGSSRGMWPLRDHDRGVIVYNNHPYAMAPGLRDGETTRFREKIKAAGIRELAYATYPTMGCSAGYTFAMVIDADHDDAEQVAGLYHAVVTESLGRLDCDGCP